MKISLLLIGFLVFTINSITAQNLCQDKGRFVEENYEVSFPKESQNIKYGSAINSSGGKQDLLLDVYQPDGDLAVNRPCILIAHGGSFLGGAKNGNDVVPIAEALTKKGYVVVSMAYRLGIDLGKVIGKPVKEQQAELLKAALRGYQDGKCAVRFLKKSAATGNPYRIDSTKIIFAGVSAGGFIALHSAYLNSEEEISEMIDLNLLKDIDGLEGKSGNEGYSSKVFGVVNLCGALGLASWVEKGDAPLISMHGTKDDVVPYAYGASGVQGIATLPVQGSYLIDSVARAVGVESHLYTWVGADHVPFVNQGGDPQAQVFLDTTINYVSRNVYKWVCGATSIESQNLEANFNIYPNPSNDKIFISTDGFSYSISLYDAVGKQVYTQSINQNLNEISVSNLPTGIYSLHISGKNKNQIKKIVIN